jgi:import inner membrane translocase subunit TIM22
MASEGGPPAGGGGVEEIPTFRPPSIEEIQAQDMFNNCAVRTLVSGVMGGGMGIFMGALFGALETPVNQDTMTTRQNLMYSARTMSSKSFQMAKTFAIMGAIFSGAECMIEKARARHDVTNTALAGCVTGGALSARAGPQAACLGCAGFSAFSVVIEKVLERHGD